MKHSLLQATLSREEFSGRIYCTGLLDLWFWTKTFLLLEYLGRDRGRSDLIGIWFRENKGA